MSHAGVIMRPGSLATVPVIHAGSLMRLRLTTRTELKTDVANAQ